MINRKLIYKVLGQLLFIEAFLLFVSLLVAFYYQQDDIFAFIVATLTTIGGGLVLNGEDTEPITQCRAVMPISW